MKAVICRSKRFVPSAKLTRAVAVLKGITLYEYWEVVCPKKKVHFLLKDGEEHLKRVGPPVGYYPLTSDQGSAILALKQEVLDGIFDVSSLPRNDEGLVKAVEGMSMGEREAMYIEVVDVHEGDDSNNSHMPKGNEECRG